MSKFGVREVFVVPLLLCGAMVLCALVTGKLGNVSAERLYFPYFSSSISIALMSLLVTTFAWVAQLARQGADRPLWIVGARLRERAPYMLLPALLFPLFLASFTATKSAIPFIVGYTWDPFWAQADRLIFGDDVWRIAHRWLGPGASRPLEFMYVMGWGLGLIFVMALVALNASARLVARFYTAMMATWLIAGIGLAYLFSAAGPVFFHLVVKDAPDQFADLRAVLDATLKPHGPIWTTQLYLPASLHSHAAVKGGGISAMPSMHLAAAAIYVLGARRTPWLVPAIVFWVTIFVASGYFGYHYWVDGIVGAAVAVACWALAEGLVERVARFLDRRPVDTVAKPVGLGPLPDYP